MARPRSPALSPARAALEFAAAAALGLGALMLPIALGTWTRWYGDALVPPVRTAWESLGLPTLGGLLAVGFLLGRLGSARPWPLGLCTMVTMPLLALAEMLADPTSHNLWPMEFLIYGAVSLVAVGGALLGRWAQRRTEAG